MCNFCPIDSKFTVQNGLAHLYEDPRVELRLGAVVQSVTLGRRGRDRVEWLQEDPELHGTPAAIESRKDMSASAELVALGANAIFNPHILLRSDLDDGVVGRYLHEQVGVAGFVHFEGGASTQAFNGGTSCTGHHYRFARGELRRERAATLVETFTRTWLRIARASGDRTCGSPGSWRTSPRPTTA